MSIEKRRRAMGEKKISGVGQAMPPMSEEAAKELEERRVAYKEVTRPMKETRSTMKAGSAFVIGGDMASVSHFPEFVSNEAVDPLVLRKDLAKYIDNGGGFEGVLGASYDGKAQDEASRIVEGMKKLWS